MKNILILTLLAMVLTLTPVVFAAETTTTTTAMIASETITGTCGFTVTGTLDFADITVGIPSDVKSLTITNTGSVEATGTRAVMISGSNWISGSNSMDVSQTKYDTDNTPTTSLPGTPTALPDIGNLPSNTLTEYFQVSTVPYGQAAGAYHQTVTFTQAC